jgi:Na+-translocating ferredoxin:NAD+ oxidoreductase RNF subunit RnfB
MVAVIQGRHCIALTSYCSVCVERCPEPGAIDSRDLMPMIVPDLCTGCGICHQVCPAPTNAVLMLPRKSSKKEPSADGSFGGEGGAFDPTRPNAV